MEDASANSKRDGASPSPAEAVTRHAPGHHEDTLLQNLQRRNATPKLNKAKDLVRKECTRQLQKGSVRMVI